MFVIVMLLLVDITRVRLRSAPCPATTRRRRRPQPAHTGALPQRSQLLLRRKARQRRGKTEAVRVIEINGRSNHNSSNRKLNRMFEFLSYRDLFHSGEVSVAGAEVSTGELRRTGGRVQ